MNPSLLQSTRRHFFQQCSMGVGSMAMASLLADESQANQGSQIDRANPLLPKEPHFKPKAKNVIFLHMAGSPPHLDLLDYKPELVKRSDEPCPDEFYAGKQFAFTNGRPKLLGTPHQFKQFGESGTWFSDAIPNLASMADDLCVIKSMNTDQFNHAPAQLMLYTGSPRMGRPSIGSWVTYGLGTENQDLPGFVVLLSGGLNPSAGNTAWGSGFLPSVFQGVQCRSKGDPVLFASNPQGMDRELRRISLDAINGLNGIQAKELGDAETLTRIAQYELAFRMQVSVPEVMDISRETEKTITTYGAKPGDASFANNCLLARRLVENGVRYVQLFDWGWDFHGTNPNESIADGLTRRCKPMDQAVAALLKDLKERGLLEETLVVWSGEFGRTPFREGRTAKGKVLGRDHFPDAYSMFMAGGGIKPGISYGATDPLGFSVTENKVHTHDLQATLMHLLGFDHEKLTHFYQGRNFRLTDVHGKVIHDILA
ncbi:MAG: DUF1501 domain-containing protein [Pirellulaceae bacterium]|nr:DUF1501 domain-containing protein [Mariniblastus sp.]MDB4755874.1 DUF1501 domain-containing protein [Mariniblastus sp.]MDG2471102.1 DUF1501 domain-containing protein [Pirellulaceae bacterium]